jgi:hypothetical protein
LGYGLLFTAIALLLFLPWLWRNYAWTQNPIYPLFNTWFSLEPVRATASWEALGPIGMRTMVFKENWLEIALIPLRIFFQGQDDNPQYFDGRLNPFLLILTIVAWLRLRKQRDPLRREMVLLTAFTLLFMAVVFFRVDMRIRYIAPVIPPLVILATIGLHAIHSWIRARQWKNALVLAQLAVVGVATILLLLNGHYTYRLAEKVTPLEYLKGHISREAYIERHRPEYATIQYANTSLGARTKILGLFMGNRGYYHDRPITFDLFAFRDGVEQAQNGKDIHRALAQQGITHLMVQLDLFNPWAQQTFDPDVLTHLRDFFAVEVHHVYVKNGYALMALK